MPIGYGKEKLFAAMHTCVAHPGSLQERLLDAWISGLCRLREPNLTPELWKRFAELKKAMGWDHAKGDEGDWKASTDKMTEGEARQWLYEILSLFQAIMTIERRHG
jgi:hypothetical protein